MTGIFGGYCNYICNSSCYSSIIGGSYNLINSSNRSVIIGGDGGNLTNRDNTILMNGTTNFRQTIEVALTGTVSGSSYSINFNEGGIKYLDEISNDFQVNFTEFPTVPNSTVTYTLILNQGATPYMITDLTINGGGVETIKWANGATPEGNADQVDIVGLMFVFNGSGTLSQVLGQMGTFA